jgi:general secretion pathway protein I
MATGRRVRGRGFTLLEVLVALAILAVTLGALIKAATEHARNTHHLQERTLAHWVGQNVLARYEAGLLAAERGASAEGTVRQAGQNWAYRVAIDESQPESLLELALELPPVLRVEVVVWPADGTAADSRARIQGYLLP